MKRAEETNLRMKATLCFTAARPSAGLPQMAFGTEDAVWVVAA